MSEAGCFFVQVVSPWFTRGVATSTSASFALFSSADVGVSDVGVSGMSFADNFVLFVIVVDLASVVVVDLVSVFCC